MYETIGICVYLTCLIPWVCIVMLSVYGYNNPGSKISKMPYLVKGEDSGDLVFMISIMSLLMVLIIFVWPFLLITLLVRMFYLKVFVKFADKLESILGKDDEDTKTS